MREEIIKGLLALGCEELECKSRKYRQFTRSVSNYEGDPRLVRSTFYFVGKAGALRVGPCASRDAGIKRRI